MFDADTISRRLSRARIPVQYHGLGLDDWKPYSESSNAALAGVREWSGTFHRRLISTAPEGDRELLGRGIALTGPPGVGKTRLSCALATTLALEHDIAMLFVPYADFIAAMQEQRDIRPLVSRGDPRAIERFWEIDDLKRKVATYPLVLFDDVGQEGHTGTGYAERELERYIRRRFRNGLPSIVTSNLPLKSWGPVYGKSMASFIHEAFDEHFFGGRDHRIGWN